MKRKVAVLMAVLMVVAVGAAVGQEWIFLGENITGAWYLNRTSVESHGNYVTGWVRQDLSNAMKSNPLIQSMRSLFNREPSFSMNLYGIQKGSKQIRLIQYAYYDKNAYPLMSWTEEEVQRSGAGEWQYCNPGSATEVIWYALMDAAGVRY